MSLLLYYDHYYYDDDDNDDDDDDNDDDDDDDVDDDDYYYILLLSRLHCPVLYSVAILAITAMYRVLYIAALGLAFSDKKTHLIAASIWAPVNIY